MGVKRGKKKQRMAGSKDVGPYFVVWVEKGNTDFVDGIRYRTLEGAQAAAKRTLANEDFFTGARLSVVRPVGEPISG